MKRALQRTRQRGFTLIELLVALGMFLVVCGAAFTLLGSSQQRYRTESQVLTSFQEARLGLDQIVRDVDDSGYPPPTFNGGNARFYADSPFAWSPSYPGTPCQIGTGVGVQCTTPGGYDLIVETNPNPQDPLSKVQWIRYKLDLTTGTLMRGMSDKVLGTDPATDAGLANAMTPFVQNVVNVSSPPGGIPVPIFSYTCDTPTAPQPLPSPCALAGADSSPANIRDVGIALIVSAPLAGSNSGQLRIVQLLGRGRRINPNQ